ncbi:hypothetical protein UlMin_012285 [Ulmus minor]
METETTVSTIKLMNQDLVWLDHFDESNFTRWQDKLHFILTALKIIYILDPNFPPLPEPTDGDTNEVKADRKQREDDELIYREHILNALSNRLYDLYTNTKSAKEIWTALEFKYKAEEEGPKKFLISKYFDFKFLADKPLLPQIHELQIIVKKLKAIKIEIPEPFQVGAIIAKLPPTWKGYRKRVLHRSEDYSLDEIKKHLRIEEESRSRDKFEETNFGPSRARVNVVNKSNHYKSNNQKRGNCQKWNFLGPKKDQGKFKNNNKGDCFVCGKPGHFARDCKFRKKQNEAKVNAI